MGKKGESTDILKHISHTIESIWNKSIKLNLQKNIACIKKENKITWELTAEANKKAEPMVILLSILVKELNRVLYDAILLSILSEVIKGKTKTREEEKRINKLIGNLMSREWLVEQYRRAVITGCNLPDCELLIQISAMEYEKRFTTSSLCFYSDDKCPEESREMKFLGGKNLDFSVSNLRTIKKYMELAGKKNVLVLTASNKRDKLKYRMVGIASNVDDDDCVFLDITSKLSWKIYRKDPRSKIVLLEYKEGIFKIPVLERGEEAGQQIAKIDNYLSGYSKYVEKIKSTIEAAVTNASHGTSLVFIGDKEEKCNQEVGFLEKEITRLANVNRARQIEPIDLKKHVEISEGIFDIDGAVFLDMKGKCHAVGVIVDGIAKVSGDAGRGARYNSLYTYGTGLIDHSDIIFVIAIISEDGMVSVMTGDEIKKKVEDECKNKGK
jgi:hypothetical protein